ncbi:MAG: hypothetical protein AB7G28_02045 [Pirellulales bacterium]
MRLAHLVVISLPVCALLLSLAGAAAGQTVWSGLTYSFTKPGGVDGSDSKYQDFITDNAIFARGDTGGLYNAAYEVGFDNGASPELTEWASDLVLVGGIPVNDGQEISAANYASLVFDDFTAAYGGSVGNFIVGRSAVVHLIPEDIYFDIQFTNWTTGHDPLTGGFAYMRAQPPMLEPTGDYSGNFVVDAADYTIWRDTLGQTVAVQGDGADGDRSGEIDAPDYQYWKDRFGNLVPAGAAAGVPEPTTIAQLFGGLFLLVAGRRTTRQRSAG